MDCFSLLWPKAKQETIAASSVSDCVKSAADIVSHRSQAPELN